MWSLPAKQDLQEIHNYIAQGSNYYAKKVSRDIVEKFELLNAFPFMGRIVPEIENANVRGVFAYSYRLIYKIVDNNIFVLALLHFKRSFLKELIDEAKK